MIIGIAAVDRKNAIGKGGKLPWHYSSDMKFFRETTTGHAVVMGRKTWLTIGKPLKNRLNIVLSRDSSIEPQESLLVLTRHRFCDLFQWLTHDGSVCDWRRADL